MRLAIVLRAAAMLLFCWHGAGHADSGDGIAVIVARNAHGGTVDRRELAAIFKRKKHFWPDGTRIAPVNLPAGDPLRRAFSGAVLRNTPEELDDYWRDQYFHGELPPYVVASQEAMIRFVSATPGAIGYVSSCLLDRRVSEVMRLDDGPPCPRQAATP
ncbi:type 2 periplasmic-binding domain-containing protein [Cognatazoarcus halotolerans]|uniref:hypothetical protein n=1 Tax=Cognatazoarcus halotolerans TaxID=2686016 RepID=UPI0013589F03|nr:hypothetical protein [Cognatazoarcus halotolerans]MCB1900937.1 hypothetical protein [Rhodocyclaceae bacterium]MCP5310171.1 hypothetical protein [Zoogloeaceae bacterium]